MTNYLEMVKRENEVVVMMGDNSYVILKSRSTDKTEFNSLEQYLNSQHSKKVLFLDFNKLEGNILPLIKELKPIPFYECK